MRKEANITHPIRDDKEAKLKQPVLVSTMRLYYSGHRRLERGMATRKHTNTRDRTEGGAEGDKKRDWKDDASKHFLSRQKP